MSGGYPGPSVQDALEQLCKSVGDAGSDVLDVLSLVQKVLGNIKDNPREAKFRSLKLSNRKMQEGLFRFAGGKELVKAAGFEDKGDSFELPDKSIVKLNDAFQAVMRRYTAENEAGMRAKMQAVQGSKSDTSADMYNKVIEASAKGAGRAEILALSGRPEGAEALRTLQTICTNLRRFPDNKEYKSVNMASKAGQRLLPAAPLLKLAGFETTKKADGGERAEIQNVNIHVMERFIAMIAFALEPDARACSLPAATGTLSLSLGAVLGVAVGDALGAPLELLNRSPLSAEEVDAAMEMCGGGCHSVAPGQVTDDTELTICLADGLATCNGKSFPANEVAHKYCEWGSSQPFDIGNATKKVFCSRQALATDCERRALGNVDSQANGALMRCVPLAIWAFGRGLSVEELAEVAAADARLSHPDHTVIAANVAYLVAILSLLRSGGDRAGALQAVSALVSAQKSKDSPGWSNVEAWLQESLGPQGCDFVGPKGGGWVKFGFTHAFRFLRLGTSFEDAMRLTLAGGGDTDTNAAIVGGLIGAAVGMQGIPEHCLRSVLSCNTAKGRPRTPVYHPNRLPALIEKLHSSPATS